MGRETEWMPVERSMWVREEINLDRDLEFIREEFRAGFELIARIDRPAAAIFGSARIATEHPWYRLARETGAAFAREGFGVVTGGGPGLMEAANRGAKQAGGLSVGLGIQLPHEQDLNHWLDLSYDFKHFYARKVCFVKASEGFVAFPGGFGTNDELFEALTLIQTGKVRRFPVVLFGREHWEPMVAWIRDRLLREGTVSARDIDLFVVTDDPETAVRAVVDPYRGTVGPRG
jgi:uncharacterized protein (TIGR00730 family)